MQAVLEVTAGPHTGRRIALTPGVPVRIGRTSKSDYVVAEDTFLSSAHFYVEWSGEQCVVRDLNSSNGTFLNGGRTMESPVLEGDIITAGQSSFALRLNPTDVMATVLPAVGLDETRPMPLPFNAAPLPANAPPLPVTAPPPPPINAAPSPAPLLPDLPPAQRGLLELLRGLADPIFVVLDRSSGSSVVDSVRSAGGVIEVLSEATGACITSVNAESRVAAQLAAEGWGNGWCIYATSRQPLNIVRNHLRRFQSLLTADGAEFQIRFFNPALLRNLLPTLSTDEAKALFGPLSAILTEGNTPSELMLFMPGPPGVLTKTVPLA